MHPQFIHLRVHTEYSLSDGLAQLDSLIDLATRDHMPALGISDQNNLFATVKFYKAALSAGIKPIIGADIWLENPKEPNHPFRLTLLCQNNIGYHHLLELISQSFLEGQTQHHVIVRREWLLARSEGFIVLSGAKEGDVGRALLADHLAEAKSFCTFWQTHFKDRYYLELRRTGHPEDEPYLQAALALARKENIPVVATNDIRFEAREDFEAHEARVCIHAGYTLADPRRPKHYTEQQYFRTQAQMCELFSDIPEALQNTIEIAKRCTVSLTLGQNFLPRCTVPENFTTEQWLAKSAEDGLVNRLTTWQIPTDKHSTYRTRLETELDVINRMGFAAYFLIVADFTRWARNNDVPVGPGRGSGPGSVVAWSLDITDLDPIAHDLLFERFLNPERVSMPDFDIDFCMEGRDRVIDYVIQTHGKESVAQIITYGTMAARAVVRDVGRVLNMPYGYVDKLAKLIPFEIGMTLDKALQQEVQLNARYTNEDEVRTLIDLARRLEGITRNVGRHAGGVVIAPSHLTEYTPLYCEFGEPEHPVTQFDKDDVEAVGLVKFDFLGLRTLTIIDRAIKNIHSEKLIDIRQIPTDDAETFALLKSCKTTAVFQLESRGMKDLVKRLQPDCFEDIVALVALFRPGPLQSGMVEDFINRKHGRAHVSYPHPALEPILRSTYGVIVYQEQVMQIAQVLAGYSLGSADILRRAMGKKKPEEMAIQREIFCKGSIARGVSAETATYIFDLMEKFAGYGFNKSHSAAYALIAYQTAWLKAHYSAAYMAAVLSSDMDHTEKVVLFIQDCHALGLHVAPPDVNQSDYFFKVVDEKNLRWGLGAIKGLGENAIAAIVQARTQDGPFKDLFDFCKRVDARKMNRRALETLIRAGAFDAIDANRANVMANIDLALKHAAQTIRDQTIGQGDLFGEAHSASAVQTIHATPAWSEQQRLTGEKESLGMYISGHPIHRYLNELSQFTTARIHELRPATGQTATIAGIVTQIRSIQTKRGDRMAVFTIEDGSGTMDALCFPETFQRFRDLLLKDQLLIILGEISLDEFSGGNRIVVSDILTIDAAREKFGKYLAIHLPEEKSEQLDTLATILKKYQGGRCPIKIHYAKQQARAALQLSDAWHVKPSDTLFEMITEWLNGERVEMVY
ncbi:MAG: DNA polymerase III subunit alpha [Gammaproteobacteria bacterium]|nr:DNA polymerase III subunit alpha [Gammaproteobacteria bacterium]